MKREPFFWISVSCGIAIMAFIILPLIQLITSPSVEMVRESIGDRNILRSIWLSIYTAGLASVISFVLGTPLAYLLARYDFSGKRLVEGIIDLPIAIPHPVVGIAILSVAGKNHWIGQILSELGIRIMGSVTGIFDNGFYYEVHLRVGADTFKSLITKRSLFELKLQESGGAFLSFMASAVHSF
jgi:molybdate/tungstate transport system permease protein